MSGVDDVLARARAMSPGIGESVHRLIGCSWGRDVSTEADPHECQERALQMVVVHLPDGSEKTLKLCPKHEAVVLAETTPRQRP